MSLKAVETNQKALGSLITIEDISGILLVTPSVEIPFSKPSEPIHSVSVVREYKSRTGWRIRQRLGLVE